MAKKIPKYVVFVRNLNCESIIGQCLASIRSQDIFEDLHVRVLDSGSLDKSCEIIEKFSEVELKRIRKEEYIPAKILNNIVNEFQNSERIFLINSDCVLLRVDSLRSLMDHESRNEEKKIAGVFGRQVPRPEAFVPVVNDYYKTFPKALLSELSWMVFSAPISMINPSICIKHKFPSKSWASEDVFWAKNIRKKGYWTSYSSSSIAMHSHNFSILQASRRCIVDGESDTRNGVVKTPLYKTLLRAFYGACKDFSLYKQRSTLHRWPHSFVLRFVEQFSFWWGATISSRKKDGLEEMRKVARKIHDERHERNKNITDGVKQR